MIYTWNFILYYLIERRTRVYGRLKKINCGINRIARAREIHEFFGLVWLAELVLSVLIKMGVTSLRAPIFVACL